MIIYPDDYTAQTDATTYTHAQWPAMEASGVVFLPAAGLHNGSTVYYAGTFGYYWSSTPNTSIASFAYNLGFNSTNVFPSNYNYRYYGYSVRLVTEL